MTLVLKRGLSLGAALLVGCAGSAWSTGSAVRSGELPPLIPREVLFGNPQIMSVNLSPDGRWISYLAPDQGVLNLWVVIWMANPQGGCSLSSVIVPRCRGTGRPTAGI